MGDLNDDMCISAHGRVHGRDGEDKLVEPCQTGRENVTVARMRDLSAGFQSKVERDRLLSGRHGRAEFTLLRAASKILHDGRALRARRVALQNIDCPSLCDDVLVCVCVLTTTVVKGKTTRAGTVMAPLRL